MLFPAKNYLFKLTKKKKKKQTEKGVDAVLVFYC